MASKVRFRDTRIFGPDDWLMCRDPDSNWGRLPLQGSALPLSYPGDFENVKTRPGSIIPEQVACRKRSALTIGRVAGNWLLRIFILLQRSELGLNHPGSIGLHFFHLTGAGLPGFDGVSCAWFFYHSAVTLRRAGPGASSEPPKPGYAGNMLKDLALISGIAMSLAILPQTYKIWKDKAARDVSAFTFVILTIGCFIWVLYGLEQDDSPTIWSFGIRFLAAGVTLALIFRFSKKR